MLYEYLRPRQVRVVTAAVMLSLFLAAVEVTVVSTAMPSIVGQLGGLHIFSWVFSVYFLASTTMTPVFGRLSDIYGRRPVYLIGMAIFLAGSALSGLARSMPQLVLFRAIQGIGGGALLPMAFILIGDLYPLERRAKMQGLFSGVWAVAGLMGPLLGGFLVDNVSWRWVFFVNVPFGLLAMGLVLSHLLEPASHRQERHVDVRGALLLVVASGALILLLNEGLRAGFLSQPTGWLTVLIVVVGYLVFLRTERRAPEPLLPLDLFRTRIFSVAALQGFLGGMGHFGAIAFVPLFMQGVLGTSATQAGAALTPTVLSWTTASIIASRLILRLGLRLVATVGALLLLAAAWLLYGLGPGASYVQVAAAMALVGLGMGSTVPTFLIAVQSVAARHELGIATSSIQFSRTMGGTLGVALMGGIMAATLRTGLEAQGLAGLAQLDVQALVQQGAASVPAELRSAFRGVLGAAIHRAFLMPVVLSAVGVAVAWLTPAGLVAAYARRPGRAPARAVGEEA